MWQEEFGAVEQSVMSLGRLINLPTVPTVLIGKSAIYLESDGSLYKSSLSKKVQVSFAVIASYLLNNRIYIY
jgi:hypothetical protein